MPLRESFGISLDALRWVWAGGRYALVSSARSMDTPSRLLHVNDISNAKQLSMQKSSNDGDKYTDVYTNV